MTTSILPVKLSLFKLPFTLKEIAFFFGGGHKHIHVGAEVGCMGFFFPNKLF
jgi:hypothetical protein